LSILAVLFFIPLQLVWLPFSLIGAGIVAYRQLIVSRRLGVSQTAVEIINGRWAMHVFDLREDEATARLARVLPNNSVFGLWLTLFPIWCVSQLLQRPFLYPTLPDPERATLANLVPSRTAEFDALIAANASSSAQLVILGAGLDTRAYGTLKGSGLAIYELDEPTNQAHKRAALSAAGIDASHVRFCAVDFGQSDWTKALLATDFDPARTTLFLWEGVTLYLPREAIADTLVSLKALSPSGSVVLTDIYAKRFVDLAKGKAIGWSLEMTDEAMNFGLDFEAEPNALTNFAQNHEVALGHHQFLGAVSKRGPFVVIAQLEL